jgi:RimJ/RimL family protein N-acetyltransferase
MKPILRDFPYSLETERLTIRGPLPGDGHEVRTAVIESQEELKPWLSWAVDIPSEEEYEARVRQGLLNYLARTDLWMMLLLKGTGTIIGGSGLHRIDWSVPRFEIGYWARTRFAGQGYIREAATAISDFAFHTLGAKRVEIRCDALNQRSAAVAQRLGFTLEATLRNEARHHLTNEVRDTLVFAKVTEK